MDTVKKILMVLSKILGILVMIIGILIGALGVILLVHTIISQYFILLGDDISLVLFAVLLFYIGWRLFHIKKTICFINKIVYHIKNREQIQYEKEQKRHETALEEAEKSALERQELGEDILEEKTNVFDVWNQKQKEREHKNAEVLDAWKSMKEGYIDKPDSERKQNINIHMCSGTDIIWKAVFIISLFMVIGSLVSIPIFCTVLEQQYLGILTGVLTVLFWGGFVLVWWAKGHIEGEKNVIMVSTDQNILYKMDLNKMFAPQFEDMPVSQVRRMAYLHKKGEENKATQKKIDFLLQNKNELGKLMDTIINPETEERVFLDWTVKRLNSPMLINKIFRTYIKYWDEIEDKWIFSPLPKATEGYDQICQLVIRRNINI